VKPRIMHRGDKIRGDGAASALCSKVPRAINMRVASWTARDSAVTCPKCLAIIGARHVAAC
jgi:hypothetical protein